MLDKNEKQVNVAKFIKGLKFLEEKIGKNKKIGIIFS